MAKRKQRPEHHPAVAKLLADATSNVDSETREMHLVPASYLRRWAEDSKVRVTDLDTGRSRLRPPKKVCRVRDFYRLDDPALDPVEVPPQLAETLFGRVESQARPILDKILDRRPTDVDVRSVLSSDERAWILWYISLQAVRGMAFRQQMQEADRRFFLLQIEHLDSEASVAAHLRRHYDREPTSEELSETQDILARFRSGELFVQSPDASLTGLATGTAEPLHEPLNKRHWVLVETPRVLITTDEPVVPIGGPGFDRDARTGIGTAGVLVMPLDPGAALCLFDGDRFEVPPTGELDSIEVSELNREMAAHAHRFLIERPGKKVGERLWVPQRPDAVRWEPREMLIEPCGGVAIRSWVPTRWANLGSPPPWPVDRWWNDAGRLRGPSKYV